MNPTITITAKDIETVLRLAESEAPELKSERLLPLLDHDEVQAVFLASQGPLSDQRAKAHHVIAQQLFRRGFLPEHANWAYILQTGLCGQGYWDFVAEKLGESSHEINDPADASDVIADLLLKAAQNGGFPAVKLLIRGAVATFASEYGKTKEEIEALPEPDEDILRDLSEAVLTPAYAQ